jgi:SAM-dependent methyltransferase
MPGATNSGPDHACSPAAFDRLYSGARDPWQFATSAYERFRYLVTMRALLRQRYRHALEPGCSVGELTALLAERCAQVSASDVAAGAVEVARRRCQEFTHVKIECADLRCSIAEGPFDLIVFSEIGYYFSAPDLRRLACDLASRLAPGGEFVAVHWLGHSADHRLHGDEVHQILFDDIGLAPQGGERHWQFRLDSWVRA